jgi:hypothetical protein
MIRQGAVVNAKSFKSTAKAIALAFALSASAGTFALAADMPVKAPPKPAPAPPFFFVNDTSVSFTYYFDWTDPGIPSGMQLVQGGIANTRNTFWMAQGEIDHFDIWEYGATLIHVEVNQSSDRDPIQGQPGATGAREYFGFAQETISGNALTHSKAFTTPFTNDVGILMRLTAGTENHFLAEETTQYDIGGNIDFALPKILGGSMQVGIAAHYEHTHNEFDACGPGVAFAGVGSGGFAGACAGGGAFGGDRNFEWTWRILEFNVLPLGPLLGSWADPAHITNILSVIGPKGTGISAANCIALGCGGPINGALITNETKTEVFEDVRLSFDTSKIFWGKPGIWDTYVGYRYWYNRFGTNHNAPLFAGCATCFFGGPFGAPGTSVMSTAYVGTTYHFK